MASRIGGDAPSLSHLLKVDGLSSHLLSYLDLHAAAALRGSVRDLSLQKIYETTPQPLTLAERLSNRRFSELRRVPMSESLRRLFSPYHLRVSNEPLRGRTERVDGACEIALDASDEDKARMIDTVSPELQQVLLRDAIVNGRWKQLVSRDGMRVRSVTPKLFREALEIISHIQGIECGRLFVICPRDPLAMGQLLFEAKAQLRLTKHRSSVAQQIRSFPLKAFQEVVMARRQQHRARWMRAFCVVSVVGTVALGASSWRGETQGEQEMQWRRLATLAIFEITALGTLLACF